MSVLNLKNPLLPTKLLLACISCFLPTSRLSQEKRPSVHAVYKVLITLCKGQKQRGWEVGLGRWWGGRFTAVKPLRLFLFSYFEKNHSR